MKSFSNIGPKGSKFVNVKSLSYDNDGDQNETCTRNSVETSCKEFDFLKKILKNGRRAGKARKSKSTSETAFEVNNNDNNWLMNLLYIVVLQFGSVWVLYGLSNMADV